MEVIEKKRVAAYVKLAKLWERSREKAVAHQLEYYTEKFKDSEVYELVAVYIDITGQKDIPNRPEMVHLLHDCMEGQIDVIATQTKAYLAANAADFCYLVKFLFDLDPPIHIVTEEEKYRINTITNDEDQREALYGMANKFASMTQNEYANWLEQMLLRMEKLDEPQ